LQDRLPEVASRHGNSAEKLKQIFLHDNDLWLDPAENLLYLCSFGISEGEALPEPAESAIPTGPFPLDQTFQLHSLDGASKVIYLDFDGHVTSGTIWNSNFNGEEDIVSVPYNFEGSTGSFSDGELSRIQNIWARVAEDFAIYNIDVTTEDPGIDALRRIGSGDEYYGIRVIISATNYFYPGAGGVAYVGSFDWNSDTPTFVFNSNEKYVTDAASHEIGHTLGLSHDGATDGTAYYEGHGDWAPIMGVGYYEPITQWSKGEYAGANNTEDDLAVMLTNGASYRTDDHGDWLDSATMLSDEILYGSGIIERTGDIDVFGFQTQAGNISINIDPANLDPNLDILAQVIDDGGNIIGEDDKYYILPASLNLNLPAGTYYILINGVGTGDPDTGYTDYASLGQYFISGTLPEYEVIHRINAGGPEYTDSFGKHWSADYGFNTGEIFIVSDSISGTSDPILYQSERWDPAAAPDLSYNLAVTPGFSYLVRLHFADIYSGTSEPGTRIFDVAIEGQTVLDDFDIVAEVGPLSAIIKEFYVEVGDNSLEIEFIPGIQRPKISAIEILATGENVDLDSDGYTSDVDCDDSNASIHPGANEIAADGIDQNCDGGDLCFVDADDDGYRPNETSTVVSTDLVCTDSGEAVSSDPIDDCDDSNASIHPGANDTNCDGIDNDCLNGIDDGYVDIPTICGVGACSAAGQIECQNSSTINTCEPKTPIEEICGDGIDQDCNGNDLICPDTDADGVEDDIDNCPNIPNANQSDLDNDDIGDACDDDFKCDWFIIPLPDNKGAVIICL
jgi:hypothetical protein